MISKESNTALKRLGEQLRAFRLERKDRQSDFAARLGVSIPTLRKIENGDPTVVIGTWIDALWLLGRLDDLKKILEPRVSLFDQWDRQQGHKTKKRVRK